MEPPIQPVHGRWVWRGSQLPDRPEWHEHLRAAELAALQGNEEGDGATALAKLCRHWRGYLERGAGVVRAGRIPVEDHDDAVLETMFGALADQLGTRVSQTTSGDLLFRVCDAGLGSGDSRARGPNSSRELTFHNDRCDVIAFLCVRQAADGGETVLASAGAVHNAILERRPDLAAVLYQPFWWQRHNIDGANRHPHYAMPPFAVEQGRFAVTLMQVLIDRAHRDPEVPDLSEAQLEALEMVQRIAGDPAFHLRFRLQPGELLLVNNYVTLHSRAGFQDPPDAPGRLLLRAWVSVPDSRPLPASWEAHYGGVQAGALRGGIRTGSQAS